MALPADQVKINFDQATDDPKLARQDMSDNVDKFNSLKAVLGEGVELDIGDGLKDDGAGKLALDLAADSGLEINTAKVRIKAGVNSGIKRAASDAGIEIDIDGTTVQSAVDTLADFVLMHDTSPGQKRKILLTDLIARASQAEAEAGIDTVKTMTAIRVQQAITKLALKPEMFTSSGTYNVPAGITKVLIELVGSGGGGASRGINTSGGGGGGGGFVRSIAAVTGGGTETITIGAAGIGGVGVSVNGTAGSNCTFGTKVTGNGGGFGLATGGAGSGGAASTTEKEIIILNGLGGVVGGGAGANGGAGGGVHHSQTAGGAGGTGGSVDGKIPTLLGGGGGGAADQSGGDGGNGKEGYILVTPIIET